MKNDTLDYYDQLPVCRTNLQELFADDRYFHEVPQDWQVLITDVRGSTAAVLGGRYREVNHAATGSAVAVLNIALNQGISIPFFFGGDGVTFLIPKKLNVELTTALHRYRMALVQESGLDLRVGYVEIKTLYEAGYNLKLARYNKGGGIDMPVVLGNGLSAAEQLIKNNWVPIYNEVPGEETDLNGMLCRWDEIPPPTDGQEIITLLVVSKDDQQQGGIFSIVLAHLEAIFGVAEKRQPISPEKLRLRSTFKKPLEEMRRYNGFLRVIKWFSTLYINLLGKLYFKTQQGREYLQKLVTGSETLLVDGRFNTVFTGTGEQRNKLRLLLDEMERNNLLTYGIHSSTASIMSCYVRNSESQHIYFVDGGKGGYTLAAQMLKQKLLNKNIPK